MNFSLLIIDPQVDFHEGGSLAVSRAMEDSQRIAYFIRVHINRINRIFVTLDTHNKNHIAHACVWKDRDGNEPSSFTYISHQNVVESIWQPKDPSLLVHCLEYTKALEGKGRFQLTIWPERCITDSPGNEVIPALKEALDEWSTNRPDREISYIRKGMNNLTEMYSVLQAEVPLVDDPQTQLNEVLLNQLLQCEKLVICGQALSHCVNYTTRDLVQYWPSPPSSLSSPSLTPRTTKDIILLLDGSSSVAGCEQAAQEFVQAMQAQGVQTCKMAEVEHVLS